MKKIFFPTYGGGHVRIVIPIINELVARDYNSVILALTTSVHDLDKAGIKYKKLQDYIELFEDQQKIYNLGQQFIEDDYNNESGLEKEDLLLYIGLNIYDLSLQKSEQEARQLYQNHGRKIFFPYNVMRKIIESEKPDFILVTCGQRAEKAAAIVGNDLNIPVLRIIDLLGEKKIIPYQAKVCVLNDIAKRNILNYNLHLNQDDVYVTGQPNLEMRIDESERVEFSLRHDLSDYKKVISFFSQPGILDRAIVVENMISMLREKTEYLGFIKLHPNEDIGLYKSFLDEKPQNVIITKEEDTNLILYHSDAVITFYSTVGLQAIAADKPLVTIHLSDKRYPIDYSQYRCAVKIGDMEDLGSVLEDVLNDGIIGKRLAEQRSKMSIPKSSAANIADVIRKLERENMS